MIPRTKYIWLKQSYKRMSDKRNEVKYHGLEPVKDILGRMSDHKEL